MNGAMENHSESNSLEWDDWRQVGLFDRFVFVFLFIDQQGECLLPALVGKFYDQQAYTDVTFQLSDGSNVQVFWSFGEAIMSEQQFP